MWVVCVYVVQIIRIGEWEWTKRARESVVASVCM